jgi:putative tricarboxylic transport membrane protein
MDWKPERPIEIVAGTPPGGGLDRTARALLKAIETHDLLEVPVHVKNVPGDGARNAWRYMDEHRGDPHVVSISHPNLTTDRLVGLATFDHRDYTPIAMLYTEYIAFAIHDDAPLRDGAGLIDQLARFAPRTTIALSTALGNPNHIALARLVTHAGAEPKAPIVRVFDSALLAVADVVERNADVAAVTAASTKSALSSGKVRVIGVSAPQRLAGTLAHVPTWREQGVDCVVGAWRGVTGAQGIGASHVRFWEKTLRAVIATRTWQDELERDGLSATYTDAAALRRFLDSERTEMAAALRELGLLKEPAG